MSHSLPQTLDRKQIRGQEKLLREGDTCFGFLKNREDARLKKESNGRGDE